ncbi:MAG: Uma2 family endonuclease [Thermoanaerobaculia bacterium]
MARRHMILSEENLRIPEDASTYDGFLRWTESDGFPETGRIDYLAGEIDAQMSPEDLYTHGAVKTAIASKLSLLVVEEELGDVFIDRTQVRSRFAQLSAEPDLVVVLLDSLDQERVRPVPSRRKSPDRFVALEGAVDVVVEIISDGSVRKDTQRLPELYARAGVRELWIVDARDEGLRFRILELRDGAYAEVEVKPEGWVPSARLGWDFRLRSRRAGPFRWRYTLDAQR